MNIQAILPQINNAVNLSSNSIKCGDEFERLLQQVNEETDIAEMKKYLDKKFNVNTVVVEYSCEKTDTEAEIYDTAMLEKYDMHGGRNVVISKKTLLRMKKDSAFRQKVYKSIEDMPWSSKLTGGEVKGDGVFIHEDGTGGYYMEFDWGEEDDNKKSKKIVASKNMLNELTQKFSTVDYQITETDLIAIMEIMATGYDRKSNLQAGDVYGKMLVLTFEDNEDDMMNRILSLINTREEIIQMSGMNQHLLNFKGLMIDEVQRVIIREKIEDNPSKPIYIQTVWGVGYKFNNKLK